MKHIQKIAPKSLEELQVFIKGHRPAFYSSSRTSTVIPFEKLEESSELYQSLMGSDTTWLDLAALPGEIELLGEEVRIRGLVSWSELRSYLNHQGRDIMTSPTESLASVLAGLATSATGERSFGYGTLRDQVVSLKYLNHEAEVISLSSQRPFPSFKSLASYGQSYLPYQQFKNAPFPRFQLETDLMIGTEGQLGVIVEATLKTIPLRPLTYLFFKLSPWEMEDALHLKIFHFARDRRDRIAACELIDSHSLSYLPKEENPSPGRDLIFFEVASNDFEALYEELEQELPEVDLEHTFSMNEAKARALRVAVPRAIFESNTMAGVTKKGTDVQVRAENFPDLLEFYRHWAQGDIAFNLFGHFGDAHLHFNFMPAPDRAQECDQKLEELYQFVHKVEGSPFAEHGIGLLKKRYIKNFYGQAQRELFAELKHHYDPKRQFFPQGFMESVK